MIVTALPTCMKHSHYLWTTPILPHLSGNGKPIMEGAIPEVPITQFLYKQHVNAAVVRPNKEVERKPQLCTPPECIYIP